MKLSRVIILLFLGVFFKVAVADSSTQVYWLELEIESSVYDNITDYLKKLKIINITNASVTDITITTDCKLDETHKNCSCMVDYTYSEEMCKKYGCCNDTCRQNVNDIAVCLPKSRVSINGVTTFANESCILLCDPSKKNTDEYKENNEKMIQMLAKQFSTLKNFDSLIINSYRSGSVIVNYTVQVMGSVTLEQLENVTNSLPASDLKTTGFVLIKGPQGPIDIDSSVNITCRPQEKIGVVRWYLIDEWNTKKTEITTGQEADFTSNVLTMEDNVHLNHISGSWKGSIQCVYAKGSIQHTASTVLDIALLPEIQAKSTPQFSDCINNQFKKAIIECKISQSTENYTVTWNTALSFTEIGPEIQNNVLTYKAEAIINCESYNMNRNETLNVACTFTNKRAKSNQNKTQKVEIPVILGISKFCEEDRVWPITKNNYTAIIPCENSAVGSKMRPCNEGWKEEFSTCVNLELNSIKKDIETLNKGIGLIKDDADGLFIRIKDSTTVQTFNSYANINASVGILEAMNKVSKQQSNQWNDTVMPNFVSAISNALNKTDSWNNPETKNTNLSVTYLQTVENIISNSNLTMSQPQKSNNVKLEVCNKTGGEHCSNFNASISTDSSVVVVAFRNLHEILPKYETRPLETTILSVTTVNNKTNPISVQMMFDHGEDRLRNHEMYCLFWDEHNNTWSKDGCTWGGAGKQKLCTCTHNSAFTIMMSKNAETLPYMKELTYAGLGVSIVSLVLCLIIEFLVWDTVVKSDISNFRHVALVNISFCLLMAHCGFLATSKPEAIPQNWCSILTVFKHFFFLAVFFWMLCLSIVLLHQLIFVFDQLRKKVFLVLSITVGYVCPLICVATTFITFENGQEDKYYSKETCWLIYQGVLKGSLFSFVIPALTIVMVNLFTLVVVIMKIVTPTVSDSKARDNKDVARGMIKTIVFLSPVLGITWLLGILVLYLDLTQKPFAQIVSYAFTIFNSLQGFLILLTNCLVEKKVIDALQKRFQSKQSVNAKSESSGKATSSVTMK
ncbi:adhesion G protein-coupled receptor F4 isoform X2 [Carassius auratus]|uniref:Adhesion G protein-coupled receptor F4 isoform X2 n=1 Tax=Carassius auratus TaxID=7957 RepID=A0A6P6RAF5_CARAU|nr:adhesion G protein-coupled receptor F4-like isoform X2 [Carassius auratus]